MQFGLQLTERQIRDCLHDFVHLLRDLIRIRNRYPNMVFSPKDRLWAQKKLGRQYSDLHRISPEKWSLAVSSFCTMDSVSIK